MKKDRQLLEFLDSASRRQKNIVFPDTVQNEADGWRRLYAGKRPLTAAQLIGVLVLMVACLIFIGGILSVFWLYMAEGSGSVLEKAVRLVLAFSVVLIPLSAFFYFMRRSLRRVK